MNSFKKYFVSHLISVLSFPFIHHVMFRNDATATIRVGDTVDYFTGNSVIDVNTPHQSGTVTRIFDSSCLNIYDAHLAIGVDVVPHGSFIRFPSRKDKWSKEFPFLATDASVNPMYNYVVGALKDGTLKEVCRISGKFTSIVDKSRSSFPTPASDIVHAADSIALAVVSMKYCISCISVTFHSTQSFLIVISMFI